MANVLDAILANKRQEVAAARHARPIEALQALPGYFLPTRGFYSAVASPRNHGPNLIAEIKRASPSAGVICPAFDPVAIAKTYAAAGAHALSVLTDATYFGGRLEFIEQIKAEVDLPVLRKDFLIDPYQVHESRAFGADAVLLIADALPTPTLRELLQLARGLDLAVLVEAHARERLLDVLQILPEARPVGVLVGINNRDLQAQRVDLATTETLGPLVPKRFPLVAESGIRTRADVRRMHAAGARALLIGETLLRSGDPVGAVRELFG